MLDVRGKRVVVAGLGRFGGQIAAIRWLLEQGARVLVTDQASPEKLASSVAAVNEELTPGAPIEWRLGEHRESDFTQADLIVASPAIPPASAFLSAARSAGVPISTEIRLFVERCPATIVGVTGTKGKSTTTAMLGRILARQSNVHVGGNIGRSLLNDLRKIDKTDVVVLELSSFMLHYLREMRWSPHIALVTLLLQDHLDWHTSVEAYLHAKRGIIEYQRPDDFAVFNEDCPIQREWAQHTPASVRVYGMPSAQHPEWRAFPLRTPGTHNQLNAQAAFAAAQVLGLTWQQAADALADFPGLPHRLQCVHESAGVRYFDDSIATVPDAAVAALESFDPKTVIQIVGGSVKKGTSFTTLCNALTERAKAVLCIGTTGPTIAGIMGESASQSAATAYTCGDLATAMKMARQIAAPGDVVLLSPGCASYDQFQNFEERGDQFAALARQTD